MSNMQIINKSTFYPATLIASQNLADTRPQDTFARAQAATSLVTCALVETLTLPAGVLVGMRHSVEDSFSFVDRGVVGILNHSIIGITKGIGACLGALVGCSKQGAAAGRFVGQALTLPVAIAAFAARRAVDLVEIGAAFGIGIGLLPLSLMAGALGACCTSPAYN